MRAGVGGTVSLLLRVMKEAGRYSVSVTISWYWFVYVEVGAG